MINQSESIGRLKQNSNFKFDDVNTKQVERLIVCEDGDTSNILMIYIKVFKSCLVYRFFLDAGLAFCECWQDTEDIDYIEFVNSIDNTHGYIQGYNGCIYKDKTHEYDVSQQRINDIIAFEDGNNSSIVIQLIDKKLVLRCMEPQVFDSGCELVIVN